MLQNFTDQEIERDLLETGYLYRDGLQEELIKKQAVENRAGHPIDSLYIHTYTMTGTGERQAPWYRSLSGLLLCEYLSFDDIRKEWRYHGVLLGNPQFCEKIVHDPGCNCSQCTN